MGEITRQNSKLWKTKIYVENLEIYVEKSKNIVKVILERKSKNLVVKM